MKKERRSWRSVGRVVSLLLTQGSSQLLQLNHHDWRYARGGDADNRKPAHTLGDSALRLSAAETTSSPFILPVRYTADLALARCALLEYRRIPT